MASKKREFGANRSYKGKLLTMYESLFRAEDDSFIHANFWNEFFLIKPEVSYLENEIIRLNDENLSKCKSRILVYAMHTLSAIMFTLYKKANQPEKPIDFVDIAFGADNVQERMTLFVQHSNNFLTGEYSLNFKAAYIKLFLIIATGLDNINQNSLLEYIINSSIFESLIDVLRDTPMRNQFGYDVVLVMTLLVNYRKYENANPFIVKLSILDDELALNGYSQVISSSLSKFCKQFTQFHSDTHTSWFSSLGSIIGNMFAGEEESKVQLIQENNPLLLALYELTHLNRNFVITLAYTQTDTSLASSTEGLNQKQPNSGSPVLDSTNQPFNLLAIFLQYCSIAIQGTNTETIMHNVKMCFLILSCISEDQYANSLMHDANLACRVPLHRVQMHHRKANNIATISQPLAATLLDLIVEFVASHMMKKFPLELYHQCIGILLRIVCYQKRCRIRLNYQWLNLWTVLINLTKFLTSNENHLAKKMNIFALATEVVNIFNIFVTYGDTFLLSPHTYDELFYEIIRMKLIFTNLNTMALRYANSETYEYKQSASELTNALTNIRDILGHFLVKITEWLKKENISTPSENQIMEIIIQNYDSLTLKLQDNLDQFDRYSENPSHLDFFDKMVKSIIKSTRTSVEINLHDVDEMVRNYRINALLTP
ncbi:unnamed protein product [Trichogramma brassicae]|uniref:Armadillo-like helical domain-containing protein n=1 Tax=Trichogramma brassicae TaxID=86971 RepID=A0A6H5ILD7_9HYME|nr:unnamed protein product [Trichogramma brassicae]